MHAWKVNCSTGKSKRVKVQGQELADLKSQRAAGRKAMIHLQIEAAAQEAKRVQVLQALADAAGLQPDEIRVALGLN